MRERPEMLEGPTIRSLANRKKEPNDMTVKITDVVFPKRFSIFVKN